MLKLLFENFHLVKNIFDLNTPNLPVVMSVIEGNNPGKIWVDQFINPIVCLVITNGSYSFIGKRQEINEQTLLDIIEILKQNKPIKLIWKSNEISVTPFINAGFIPAERIHFHHPQIKNGDTSQIDNICSKLPTDCVVKIIDADLLKKSGWLSYLKLFYGSEKNFLKNGFGLALIQNGEIISEAFACYIGGNLVETGSVTNEKYRSKGYATLVRAFLIKECLSRNLQPISSCYLNNPASAKASEKLGFEEEFRYEFLLLNE